MFVLIRFDVEADTYTVLDTSDKVAETYSLDVIMQCLEDGITIDGITKRATDSGMYLRLRARDEAKDFESKLLLQENGLAVKVTDKPTTIKAPEEVKPVVAEEPKKEEPKVEEPKKEEPKKEEKQTVKKEVPVTKSTNQKDVSKQKPKKASTKQGTPKEVKAKTPSMQGYLNELKSKLDFSYTANNINLNDTDLFILDSTCNDFVFFKGNKIAIVLDEKLSEDFETKDKVLGVLSSIPFRNKSGEIINLYDICCGFSTAIDIYPPFAPELSIPNDCLRLEVHDLQK